MAPVFITSSPTSRRIRRRQQRQRQRCHKQQQLTQQLCNQSSNDQPASQPKNWLEMEPEDRESADTAWTHPHTEIKSAIRPSTCSNPFSVLDVGIPSPILSFPKSLLPAHSEQHASTSPDIYGIGMSTGFSVPSPETQVSKKLRRDSWASDLQKEGLIRNSYDALIQDTFVPAFTSNATEPNTQYNLATNCPEEPTESSPVRIFRVPSPLLYHRRSYAAAAGSSGSTQCDESLGFTHTRLMSEIRRETQQRKRKASTHSRKPSFVAAKLPLIGSEAISEDSVDQESPSDTASVVRQSCKGTLPPIVTTTNVYLCPRGLCQIFDCAPESRFNKPSIGSFNPLWLPDLNLVFPKMTFSGQLPACETDTLEIYDSSANNIQHLRPADTNRLTARFLDCRDRSSTQDSLDRNFTVAGAGLTVTPKNRGIEPLLGSEMDSASVTRSTVTQRPAIRPFYSPDSSNTDNNLHQKPSPAESESTVVITKSSDHFQASAVDDLFPEVDNDIVDTINVTREDAISSEDEWMWADDQWQSDTTTPQSIEASQIGLCAVEWA